MKPKSWWKSIVDAFSPAPHVALKMKLDRRLASIDLNSSQSIDRLADAAGDTFTATQIPLMRVWHREGVAAIHRIPDLLAPDRAARVAAYEHIRQKWDMSINFFDANLLSAVGDILQAALDQVEQVDSTKEMMPRIVALRRLVRDPNAKAPPPFHQAVD